MVAGFVTSEVQSVVPTGPVLSPAEMLPHHGSLTSSHSDCTSQPGGSSSPGSTLPAGWDSSAEEIADQMGTFPRPFMKQTLQPTGTQGHMVSCHYLCPYKRMSLCSLLCYVFTTHDTAGSLQTSKVTALLMRSWSAEMKVSLSVCFYFPGSGSAVFRIRSSACLFLTFCIAAHPNSPLIALYLTVQPNFARL